MARNKVDQINDAFIAILAKENAKGYEEYIKSINRELIENIDNLDAKKVRAIIKNASINLDDITLLFLIQNIVLLIVGKKLTKKEKIPFAPIIAVMGMYSLKKPKRFVQRLSHVIKGKGLNVNEQKALVLITEFKQDNKKILEQARKEARKRLDTSRIKSKTSKRMVRDLNKGLRENKSIEQIKNGLVKKYNKLSNVERALDTELHAQSEFVRLEHSKAIGFTHKTWRTQRDSRVRETCFHNNIANKRVPIDSEYRACGLEAQHPGDERLPPSDRIRCRCYDEYD